MSTFLYFAYGSNMSKRRLTTKNRAPSAKVIGTGVLKDHRLTFHKHSKKDGSGKCTIECCKSGKVYGVLFKISNVDKCKLDKEEGKVKDDSKKGYKKITVKIKMSDSGKTICGVKTYRATPVSIDRKLKPYTWYKKHVLVGAKEANLPQYYIDCLEKVPADKDPCKKREACELSIYD